MSESVCVVDDCTKPRKGKYRHCSMHRARIARHGDPHTVVEEHRAARGKCVIDGCENQDSGPHGTCSMHKSRIQRNGDPDITKKTGCPPGPSHPLSRGRDIGYPAAHGRVKRLRGSASEHQCALCGRPANDWAYNHSDPEELTSAEGPYSPEPACYVPLCRACHQVFDRRYRDADGRWRVTA